VAQIASDGEPELSKPVKIPLTPHCEVAKEKMNLKPEFPNRPVGISGLLRLIPGGARIKKARLPVPVFRNLSVARHLATRSLPGLALVVRCCIGGWRLAGGGLPLAHA
jgi:hypothetical protein